MREIENFISVVIIVVLAGVSAVIFYELYYANKYAKTEISIPVGVLEHNWGKPDKVLKYSNGGKSLFYFTIIDEYVFNVNDTGEVEFKYQENF